MPKYSFYSFNDEDFVEDNPLSRLEEEEEKRKREKDEEEKDS